MMRRREALVAVSGVVAAVVLAGCGSPAPDTATVVPEPKSAVQVSAQRRHTCVLTANGEIECFGLNEAGRLGDGTDKNRGTPSRVVFPEGVRIAALSTGLADHTCAIDAEAHVWCWGLNAFSQLGTLDLGNRTEATRVRGLDVQITAVVTAEQLTCALDATGAVWCWGNNNNYTLGQVTDRVVGVNKPGSVVPIRVPALGRVTLLRAGGNHLCALEDTGTVKCWGDNKFGQLGIGNADQTIEPRATVDLGGTVVDLALGQSHSCVLLEGGRVRCWGANQHDQLGFQSELVPGEVSFTTTPGAEIALGGPAMALVAGRFYVCVTTSDGVLRCWGKIRGDEDETNVVTVDEDLSVPVAIEGATGVRVVDAGSRHLCWLVVSGPLVCAGNDDVGQVGDGPGDAGLLAARVVVGYGA